MKQDDTTLDPNADPLEIGSGILEGIANFRPESSYSLLLDQKGYHAVEETAQFVKNNMNKNYSKIKKSALEVLSSLTEYPPNNPINLNLSESEIEAVEKTLELIEKKAD